MSDVALRMDNVYKRFRRGELYDSLRDLIPAMTGRLFRRTDLDTADNRDFWALQDVTFEVRKGEAFGIIGHNGAGKSTILKILSRIMQPTRGRMIVHGRLSALIEVTAGFHPDLTGRENIYLNGSILGMSRREIADKLESIVEFSGLSEFLDTPVKRYSSGMYARLGFSVAAHVEPEVLIVDEVLSVGDFVFQQKCVARMTQIIRDGATVVFVSHNLRAVADLCNRCLLLDHGTVRLIGEPDDVITHYMESIRAEREPDAGKGLHIAAVSLLRDNARCAHFESGDRMCIDVRVVAARTCQKVAVVVFLLDSNHYRIFNTSTERLGHPAYDLEAGEELNCSLEMDVSMAYGTYHVSVLLHRYDTGQTLDAWEPAATFFVGSDASGYRGILNCRPVVVRQRIERKR